MKKISLKEYLSQQLSPHTVEAYSKEIEDYLSHYPKAVRATHQEVMDYLSYLRTQYSKASTMNRRLSSIKAYYRYLTYSGKRKDDPARSIQFKDKRSKDIQLQDLFTTKELEELLNKRFFKASLHNRNKVLLSLLVYQGLQARELEALQTIDIDLKEATVYIRKSRTSNERTLALKSNQILLLNTYLKEDRPRLLKEKPSPFLLLDQDGKQGIAESYTSYVKRTFKNLFKERKVTITTIRQSVITNLLKAGHDLRVVQVFAGHRYPSTTEKYKQSHIEALQTAIERYHPLQ